MLRTLGLVGGEGLLPVLMATEARRAGWRVVVLAIGKAPDLSAVADRVVSCRVGELAPIVSTLREEGIRRVVLAGRVSKDGLFQGEPLDGPARELVDRSPDWTDEGLLHTAAQALEGMGIELVDQRQFLEPWLAPVGCLAGPPLTVETRSDVARGLVVARDVASYGIGQTVVIRAGTVTAVEALEGTDAAIVRGLRHAGPGAVVVKRTRPGHDYRFDVPAIGATTLALCSEGKAAALVIEAGRVAVLERDRIAAMANVAGVSLVGVAGEVGTD